MKCELDLSNMSEQRINKAWNFGFNTCHAALWLREDLPVQADQIKELGFRYVRFHNTISSYTGIYSEDEQGNPVYSFDKLDYRQGIEGRLLSFLGNQLLPGIIGTEKEKVLIL